jgi:hypothetical protein
VALVRANQGGHAGEELVMPRFYVTYSYDDEDREYFVLGGDMVGGEVRAGMVVRVPVAAGETLVGRIARVEAQEWPVTKSFGITELRHNTGLCLECPDAKVRRRWQFLCLSGWIEVEEHATVVRDDSRSPDQLDAATASQDSNAAAATPLNS